MLNTQTNVAYGVSGSCASVGFDAIDRGSVDAEPNYIYEDVIITFITGPLLI